MKNHELPKRTNKTEKESKFDENERILHTDDLVPEEDEKKK